MQEHVRIVAILNIVLGSLGLLVALFLLMIFGGVMGLVSVEAAKDPDAVAALPIVGAIGGLVFMAVTVLSAPSIVAGIGLLKGKAWARILTIVLSALNLLSVPLGTAVGIYGLWVMLHKDTERLFLAPPRADVPAI